MSPDLVAQLSQEIYAQDILALTSLHLSTLPFEARKEFCFIFNCLLKKQIGARFTTVEYLCKKEYILSWLVYGYECQETALICGMILRESVKHESLAKLLFIEQQDNQTSLPQEFSSMLFEVQLKIKGKDLLPEKVQGEEASEGLLPKDCIVSPFPPMLYKLFDYVELPTFDIASDAFATLKVKIEIWKFSIFRIHFILPLGITHQT